MMNISVKDLETAINFMGTKWSKQNNELDRKTKFIYDINSFNKLEKICKATLSKKEDRQYAYHRWVNFCSSIYCEQLFCKYGATKVENNKDKEKDIYINDIPFDVKLTVFPDTSLEKYDLDTKEGREGLANWFYNNQSGEGRYHNKNRLFVVCCGDTIEEKNKLKTNFSLIEEKIKEFMTKDMQNKIVILCRPETLIYVGFVMVKN